MQRTELYHHDNNHPEKWINSKIIQSNARTFGYVQVQGEYYQDGIPTEEEINYKAFKAAIDDFKQQNVDGVIVDVRGNGGGDPGLACDIPGFFANDTSYCIQVKAYNRETQSFDLIPGMGGPYYHAPQGDIYNGPVAVITDVGTLCAGEVLAQGFKLLSKTHPDRIRIFSMDPNTDGSVSSQYQIWMPAGFVIDYSVGRILDQNNNAIIESDNHLEGGISPDEKIPMTKENAVAIYTKGVDVVLEKAMKWLGGKG